MCTTKGDLLLAQVATRDSFYGEAAVDLIEKRVRTILMDGQPYDHSLSPGAALNLQ